MEYIATIRSIDPFPDILDIIKVCSDNKIEVLRFNLAKVGIAEEIERMCRLVEQIRKRFPFAKIMVDLPAPGSNPRLKLNTSKVYREILAGDLLTVRSGGSAVTDMDDAISVDLDRVGASVVENQLLYYSVGEGAFRVDSIVDDDRIVMMALNDFRMYDKKALVCGKLIREHIKSEFLDVIERLKPEYIALSFIETKKDIIDMIDRMPVSGALIVSKIETETGSDNIDEILRCTDGIMLGRGDLGLHSNISRMPAIQQKVVNSTKLQHKAIYVATDILESLVHRYVPSRADLADLAEIISQSPDGMVLNWGLVRSKQFPEAIRLLKSMESIY